MDARRVCKAVDEMNRKGIAGKGIKGWTSDGADDRTEVDMARDSHADEQSSAAEISMIQGATLSLVGPEIFKNALRSS